MRRSSKPRGPFRLPDGDSTMDPDAYCNSWQELGRKVCSVVGGQVYGFDPGLAIYPDGGGGSFDLRASVALKIAGLADALAAEREQRAKAERERDEANARIKHLTDREKHFAKALHVADGGQYRNDWDVAIDRVVRERDEAIWLLRAFKRGLGAEIDGRKIAEEVSDFLAAHPGKENT